MLCLPVLLTAQSLQVTGKVTSKPTGEPLSGATVTVQGSNASAVTDPEGNFTITVPGAGSVLVISYTGMKPQQNNRK